MIAVIKKNIKIEENYPFARKLEKGMRVLIEKGKQVKRDSVIAEGKVFSEKARIDIARKLDVNSEDAYKFVKCLNGESVTKETIIAQKKSNIVQKERTVFSPVTGILNLDLISNGIVSILDAARDEMVYSGIEGTVSSIIKNEKVIINSKAIVVNLFEVINGSSQGEIFIKNEPNFEPNESYLNEIVFFDKTLSFELIKNFELRGAIAIVSPSIHYPDFLKAQKLKIVVAITEGFGEIYCQKNLKDAIIKNDGFFIQIDHKEKHLILSNTNLKEDFVEKGNFKKIRKGDQIYTFNAEKYKKNAIVEEIFDDYVIARENDGNRQRFDVVFNNFQVL